MEKNISPLLRKGTTLSVIEVAFIRTVAVELEKNHGRLPVGIPEKV